MFGRAEIARLTPHVSQYSVVPELTKHIVAPLTLGAISVRRRSPISREGVASV
jgi:hypothetical protein